MDVYWISDGKIVVVYVNYYCNKILLVNGYVGDVVICVEDILWDVFWKLDVGVWFDKKYENECIFQFVIVLEMFWDVDVCFIVELKVEKCFSFNFIQV